MDLAVFGVGWMLGWLLLWRLRPLPQPDPTTNTRSERGPIAIIVPARDEADTLANLLPRLTPQLRDGDELIVVDDHSTDATATVAAALGAHVIAAPELPAGWLGKPHACCTGAQSTAAPVLLFVDADVRPAPDLLDRVELAVRRHPDSVVSIQPWHETVRWTEQASLLANTAALMGSGGFTAAGSRITPRVGFGPVLAVDRTTYARVGGHEAVREMHTEDIGMVGIVGSVELFSGRPDTSFRMHPQGMRQLVQGWTRNIATGARSTPWWLTVAVVAWVWSLAGGWLTEPWLYPLSSLQFWILGRRAGSMHPLTALLYPIAVAFFVAVFARSVVVTMLGRTVTWKQRTVAARAS